MNAMPALGKLPQPLVSYASSSIHRNGRKHTQVFARLVSHCSAELIWPTEGFAELQIQPKRGCKPTYVRRGKGMVGWGQGTRGKPLSSKMVTAFRKRSAICETTTPLQNLLIIKSLNLLIITYNEPISSLFMFPLYFLKHRSFFLPKT